MDIKPLSQTPSKRSDANYQVNIFKEKSEKS